VHFRQREVVELGRDFRASAQAGVGIAEQRGQIAAPCGIDVHAEGESPRREVVACNDDAIDRVHGAVLGRAQHRHRQQHRLAIAQAVFQRGLRPRPSSFMPLLHE
jgi:hypothetical protein